MGTDFTEENLKKILAEKTVALEKSEKIFPFKIPDAETRKFDLVVDIQRKMEQGKSIGYLKWAKKHNVKQFAETILFLQEHDIHNKETLDKQVERSAARYRELLNSIKDIEGKMEKNKKLKTHIINYSKTRETYMAYRKAGYNRKFYEEHREAILLHKAAKDAFSNLSIGEFAGLLFRKKEVYAEYKKIKKEMRDYQIAKQNVESFYTAQQEWDMEGLKRKQQER